MRLVSNVSVERWFRFGCPLITVPEVFFLLSAPLVVRSCGHRFPGLDQFSDCLASAPPARVLSDSTFRVRPPLLRTEAIGGRQACGLAQVSEKKNQPEGLNARADQVYPG
jgi:hypothetical protein